MRIVVAMSGGVDSSTVAGLLHEAGHEVIGVTLQLYDHGAATGRKGACCAGQDIHDARRVADRLGIPHYVIDAEQRFAQAVIADFADSYAAGETPVPCVRCNQSVKFSDLVDAGAWAGRGAAGHRTLRAAGGRTGRAGAASRRRSGARPELVPVRHHARAAGVQPVPAGRHAGQARGAGGGRAAGPGRGGKAGQPGHLLRALRPLYRRGGPAAAGRRRPAETSSAATAGCWAGTTGSCATRSARRAGWARRRRMAASARWCWRPNPAPGAWWSGRGMPARGGSPLREVNWLAAPPAEGLRCQVKLRAREMPQPAMVHASADGAAVLLDAPALAGTGTGLRVL